MTSEFPVFNFRALSSKAAHLIVSNWFFVVLGAFIAVPGVFLEITLSENDRLQNFVDTIESGGSPELSFEIFFFLFLALCALVAASFGALAISSFSNELEKKRKSSESFFSKTLLRKTGRVLLLETILITLVVFSGLILFLPSAFARFRDLDSLVQPLALSAFGFLVSIAVLFFFLRQYSVIYLAISNISVRSALENAAGIFRRYTRETLRIGIALFLCRFLVILSLLIIEFLLRYSSSIFLGSVSFAVILFLWLLNMVAFSVFEAWNWIMWTLFFRSIALPPETELTLQVKESVLQQESVIAPDKA